MDVEGELVNQAKSTLSSLSKLWKENGRSEDEKQEQTLKLRNDLSLVFNRAVELEKEFRSTLEKETAEAYHSLKEMAEALGEELPHDCTVFNDSEPLRQRHHRLCQSRNAMNEVTLLFPRCSFPVWLARLTTASERPSLSDRRGDGAADLRAGGIGRLAAGDGNSATPPRHSTPPRSFRLAPRTTRRAHRLSAARGRRVEGAGGDRPLAGGHRDRVGRRVGRRVSAAARGTAGMCRTAAKSPHRRNAFGGAALATRSVHRRVGRVHHCPLEHAFHCRPRARTVLGSTPRIGSLCLASGKLLSEHSFKCQDELARLQRLKSERMGTLVVEQQERLVSLHEELGLEAPPPLAEGLTGAHLESEWTRLSAAVESAEEIAAERRPIMQLFQELTALREERASFEAAASDPARLLSKKRTDPGRLLREEKRRKVFERHLPQLDRQLRAALENWEVTRGSPFLFKGVAMIEQIEATESVEKTTPSKPRTPAKSAPTRATPGRATPGMRNTPIKSTPVKGTPRALSGQKRGARSVLSPLNQSLNSRKTPRVGHGAENSPYRL